MNQFKIGQIRNQLLIGQIYNQIRNWSNPHPIIDWSTLWILWRIIYEPLSQSSEIYL